MMMIDVVSTKGSCGQATELWFRQLPERNSSHRGSEVESTGGIRSLKFLWRCFEEILKKPQAGLVWCWCWALKLEIRIISVGKGHLDQGLHTLPETLPAGLIQGTKLSFGFNCLSFGRWWSRLAHPFNDCFFAASTLPQPLLTPKSAFCQAHIQSALLAKALVFKPKMLRDDLEASLKLYVLAL